MGELITFIEAYGGEKKFFWTVTTLYQKQQVDLVFFGERLESKWGAKVGSEAEYRFFERAELMRFLVNHKVNLLEWEEKLRGTIKTMAVYASMLTDDAEKILGTKVLAEAKKAYGSFTAQLVATIDNILSAKRNKDHELPTSRSLEEAASPLRLVKDHSSKELR